MGTSTHRKPRDLRSLKKEEHFAERPRKLNHFLAQEMLYSYLSSKLDQKSKEALKDYMKDSSEIKEEMNFMLSAMSYCDELADSKISKVFLKNIKEHKSFFQRWKKLSWRHWPKWAQWTLEATSLAIFAALGLGAAISIYYSERDTQDFSRKEKIHQTPQNLKNPLIIANHLNKKNNTETSYIKEPLSKSLFKTDKTNEKAKVYKSQRIQKARKTKEKKTPS